MTLLLVAAPVALQPRDADGSPVDDKGVFLPQLRNGGVEAAVNYGVDQVCVHTLKSRRTGRGGGHWDVPHHNVWNGRKCGGSGYNLSSIMSMPVEHYHYLLFQVAVCCRNQHTCNLSRSCRHLTIDAIFHPAATTVTLSLTSEYLHGRRSKTFPSASPTTTPQRSTKSPTTSRAPATSPCPSPFGARTPGGAPL